MSFKSVPFETLHQTLEHEQVLSQGELVKLVPQQFYARNLEEFFTEFLSFLSAQASTKKCVVVFVDGVSKQVNGTDADLDSVFLHELQLRFKQVKKVDLSQLLKIKSEDIHASFEHLPLIQDVIRESAGGVFLALGSGTLTDLVKHALFLLNSDDLFVVVPTALTVTAFTSAFSVLEKTGAKKTHMSRRIDATFWIENILSCAPAPMSRAGYGDLLARFVAYGDWFLGHQLGIMERYDELAYRLMEPFSEALKQIATGFQKYPLPADVTEKTCAALAMAGIAMSVSGETTPLSGFEHVISHALDFLRMTSERDLVLHGEQVALGALTSSVCFDWLLEQDSFDEKKFVTMDEKYAKKLIFRLVMSAPYFGSDEINWDVEARSRWVTARKSQLEDVAQHFVEEFQKKNSRWIAFGPQFSKFQSHWPEIKKHLQYLTMRADEMESLLKASGLPLVPESLSLRASAQEYRWAVRFSPFVRSRPSLGDFLFWIGEDPAHIALV
jgi:glycerol-1-phosphate dehydrogenase [NAD(P)+]